MRIRCPHCHNPGEIIDDSSLSEIVCPTCGGKFSLIGSNNETETCRAGEKDIGHFTLTERLGNGAFGTVWKAKDTQLDRNVAIKIPRKGQLSGAETEQFFREARAAAQVKHPNIVSVHEVGKDNDSVYIVSDYVEGATLKETLGGQPLSPRKAAELTATIADAIHHAHQHGVIHRDLKPSNVMIDLDDQPHLLDFGLAKRESGEITMTVDGALVGTPAYMSPEQARGKGHDADCQADIYSLGVMLFEMLTGELPFRGQKRMLIVQIIKEEPPRLRSLEAHVPKDLETICLKCLEKDPSRRYASADELAADLRRYLGGMPIHARATSRIEHCWRWCRRNAAVAALSALAATLLVTGSAVSLYFGIDASNSAFAAEKAAIESRKAEAQAKVAEEVAREEKLAAEDSLHESLLSQSEMLSTSGTTGYRAAICRNLLQAVAIRPKSAGSVRLRRIATSSMGDPFARQPTLVKGSRAEIVDCVADATTSVVACACADGSVSICDTSKGVELFRMEASEQLRLVGFASGTGLLLTLDDGSRLLRGNRVSAKGLTPVWERKLPSTVTCACMSVDGVFVAVGCPSDGTSEIKTFRARDGQEIRHTHFAGKVRELAISADGKKLALNRGSTRVHVLELESGEVIGAVDPDLSAIAHLEFDRSSTLLAVGCQEGVAVYSVSDLGSLGKVVGHNVRSFEFAIDNQTLIYSSIQSNSIQFWNVATNRHHRGIIFDEEPVAILHCDSGSRIALATRGSLRSWSRLTPEKMSFSGHVGGVPCIAFSPDTKKLASVGKDGLCRIHSVETGEVERTIQAHRSGVQSVAWTPDRQFVFTGGYNSGTVRLWRVDSGERVLQIPHRCGPNNSLTADPSGRSIAVAGKNGVEIWGISEKEDGRPTTERTHTLSSQESGSLAFNSSGTVLGWAEFDARTTHGTAFVQALEEDAKRVSLPSRVHRPFQNLAFRHDHELLLLTPSFAAETWDTQASKMLSSVDVSVRRASTSIYASHIAVSPDGTRLAASSVGGDSVNIWNLVTGQLEFPLPNDEGIIWFLAWTSDGQSLAVSRNSGSIAVWNLSSVAQQLAELGLRW